MLGLRSINSVPANVAYTSNATLATVGLAANIAAGQNLNFKAWIFFTLGAAGGFQTKVVTPAAPAVYNVQITIFDTITPATDAEVITSAAAFGKALANAEIITPKFPGTLKTAPRRA